MPICVGARRTSVNFGYDAMCMPVRMSIWNAAVWTSPNPPRAVRRLILKRTVE
jgi:hypothetical protein